MIVRSSEAEAKVLVSFGLNTSCAQTGKEERSSKMTRGKGRAGQPGPSHGGRAGGQQGQQRGHVAGWVCRTTARLRQLQKLLQPLLLLLLLGLLLRHRRLPA